MDTQDWGPVAAFQADGVIEKMDAIRFGDVLLEKFLNFGVVGLLDRLVRREIYLGGGTGLQGLESIVVKVVQRFLTSDIVNRDR